MMGLKNDDVSAVRGIMIIGRDSSCRREQLRKLKSSDLGAVAFLTYDDLLAGLDALVSEMRGI